LRPKWDEASIDQAYKTQIDRLQDLLDQAMTLGLWPLAQKWGVLDRYYRLAQMLEEELLLQWKIKNEQGMDGLLKHQARFLGQTLRNPKGLLAAWAKLRQAIISVSPRMQGSPWSAFLLDQVADYAWVKKLGLEPKILLAHWFTLHQLDPQELLIGLFNLVELGAQSRPELPDLAPQMEGPNLPLGQLKGLFEQPLDQAWARLEAFWGLCWGGALAHGAAFLFGQDTKGRWALQGEVPQKTCRFEDLFGLESQLARVQAEVERFLKGERPEHILLWGARGMGKSSTALALLDAYSGRGLRLVEMAQRDIAHLNQLFPLIAGRPERYVLFLDDFGLIPGQGDFKALKSVFEGSLQQLPSNLMLLATSNKQSLVKEERLDLNLPENRQAEDELRALGDRFGIKIHFDRPVFSELKDLFDFIAKRQGQTPTVEAWAQFQRFAQTNGHDKPSARTVEQFLARS